GSAESGKRRLLVVAPSFVADCLEITVEIGICYNELFKKHGGEELVLVESLNDDPGRAEAVAEISGIH
ncbi:MAG TPA: ferrochelatase, partial [Bacteroidetes bacterium]|nr:ferrochelatase [Bacteroidota bacterium]